MLVQPSKLVHSTYATAENSVFSNFDAFRWQIVTLRQIWFIFRLRSANYLNIIFCACLCFMCVLFIFLFMLCCCCYWPYGCWFSTLINHWTLMNFI
jgi:hypothetical protein